MRIRLRRAQAMVELAMGMLALAMVVSALCGFAVYIARSLEVQNAARSGARKVGGSVDVGIYIGGYTVERLKVESDVRMPSGVIVR